MAAYRIENGAAVMVRHEQGVEVGIVLSSSNIVVAGEQHRYTVEFADRTNSSWPASVVTDIVG